MIQHIHCFRPHLHRDSANITHKTKSVKIFMLKRKRMSYATADDHPVFSRTSSLKLIVMQLLLRLHQLRHRSCMFAPSAAPSSYPICNWSIVRTNHPGNRTPRTIQVATTETAIIFPSTKHVVPCSNISSTAPDLHAAFPLQEITFVYRPLLRTNATPFLGQLRSSQPSTLAQLYDSFVRLLAARPTPMQQIFEN